MCMLNTLLKVFCAYHTNYREMFKDYLNIGDELWSWDKILDPIASYFEDVNTHTFKFLEPKVDFFKKMDHQFN